MMRAEAVAAESDQSLSVVDSAQTLPVAAIVRRCLQSVVAAAEYSGRIFPYSEAAELDSCSD